MLPQDLILVRHGESEGNVASRASKDGDESHFTPEFRGRHSSVFRLSPEGRRQAEVTGRWLRVEFYEEGHFFDRHFTSEYVRAMETAALLALPASKWYTNFYLREREWGQADNLPYRERQDRFHEQMKLKNVEPFYWKPPGGESIADLCQRLYIVLGTLHREHSDKRVIIVCHGEVMWGFRILIERISQERYRELDLSEDPKDRMHNCQVLHYSRRERGTGKLSKYANWMRSLCPKDGELSSPWVEIERRTYSSDELLARAEKSPSMIE